MRNLEKIYILEQTQFEPWGIHTYRVIKQNVNWGYLGQSIKGQNTGCETYIALSMKFNAKLALISLQIYASIQKP